MRTCRRWLARAAPNHRSRSGIIERPPSAELRPDQSDEATLGSLRRARSSDRAYIERDLGLDEIVAVGRRPRLRPTDPRHDRPRRVQTSSGTARSEDHASRVRSRSTHADHGASSVRVEPACNRGHEHVATGRCVLIGCRRRGERRLRWNLVLFRSTQRNLLRQTRCYNKWTERLSCSPPSSSTSIGPQLART